MKNFPIKDSNTEKEYWISRAICVAVFAIIGHLIIKI